MTTKYTDINNIYNKKPSDEKQQDNRFNESDKAGLKDMWMREGDVVGEKNNTQGPSFIYIKTYIQARITGPGA